MNRFSRILCSCECETGNLIRSVNVSLGLSFKSFISRRISSTADSFLSVTV